MDVIIYLIVLIFSVAYAFWHEGYESGKIDEQQRQLEEEKVWQTMKTVYNNIYDERLIDKYDFSTTNV